MEILTEAAKKYFENLLRENKEREDQTSSVLDEPDKKVIHRTEKRKLKRYNLSQTAKILNLPRQTLYYWMKKGWVKPWRDHRRYPVFTVFDVEEIIKWRNTIK